MTRKMDVEQALRWAFREELTKAARENAEMGAMVSGLAAMNSYAELLTRIDCNPYGVVPDLRAIGPPHLDAVLLGDAARALDRLRVCVPQGWNPIRDLGDLGPLGEASIARALDAESVIERDGERRFKARASMMVMHHAVIGDAPDWEAEKPRVEEVSANGKAKWFLMRRVWEGDIGGNPRLGSWHDVEVDGYDKRGKRPFAGACRKYYLDPDPIPAIVERIAYEIWRGALDWIFDEDAGTLEMTLVRSARPDRPWETGARTAVVWRVV